MTVIVRESSGQPAITRLYVENDQDNATAGKV